MIRRRFSLDSFLKFYGIYFNACCQNIAIQKLKCLFSSVVCDEIKRRNEWIFNKTKKKCLKGTNESIRSFSLCRRTSEWSGQWNSK